ncbi:MAG: GIY-YIG nuclease family protein [Patescibacteria group bacterium]
MHYLYILHSKKDANLYVGTTNNAERRLAEHNAGQVASTKNRRPLAIVYLKPYPTKREAAKQEWLIKHTPGAGKNKKDLIKQYQQTKRA